MPNKAEKQQKSGEDRLKEAAKDFKKIMAEVIPYTEKSNVVVLSTADKWCDTSTINVLTQKVCLTSSK